MDILFTLVDMFINSGVPFLVVFRLLIYKIPAIMVLFFPMAVLFAIMLILVRMAKDNEITILRTSGVNIFRVLIPLFIIAFTTAIFSFFINEKVVPWTNHVSDNLIQKSIERIPPPDIAENIFFKDAGDRYFYIKSINAKSGVMNTLMIYELTTGLPRVICADSASWNKKTWELHNGYIQEFNNQGLVEYTSRFESFQIHVDREVQSFYTMQKNARQMDSKELQNQIKTLKQGGISTKDLQVELYMKYSLPAACAVFALIGISFCLWLVRSSKDWWGVILAVCISVLSVGFYFFLVAICRSLGRSGALIPLLSAWLPNLIYGILALFVIFYFVLRR
jgi:lipopolysaccharide export system permease protein